MLQRIQTVYLFLAFVFCFLYLMFPTATVVLDDVSISIKPYELKVAEVAIGEELKVIEAEIDEKLNVGLFQVALVLLAFAIMVITIIATFKYKKRVLQIRLGRMNILLLLTLIVLSFVYIDFVKAQLLAEIDYREGIGIFFPFVSIILIFLANRAIRRDEALIRSSGRIR